MVRLTAADARQLDEVVGAVRSVLGDDVVAAYLYGSATSSGLRPESDLDVLVVVSAPLAARGPALAAAVMPLSGWRNGLRPLELTVVLADAVRPWLYPPARELQYGEWLRADFEAWEGAGPAPWGDPADPDLAVLLTQVLADGHALVGPRAVAVLDPVPFPDVLRATVAGVPDLLADLADDTRNVLLTLARVLATLRTGRIHSKDGAVAVVRPSVPDDLVALLDLAAAAYRGQAQDDGSPLLGEADRLAGWLVAEIELLHDRGDFDGT